MNYLERNKLFCAYKKIYPFLKPLADIPNRINTHIYVIDKFETWLDDEVYVRNGTYNIHNFEKAIGFIRKNELYKVKDIYNKRK